MFVFKNRLTFALYIFAVSLVSASQSRAGSEFPHSVSFATALTDVQNALLYSVYRFDTDTNESLADMAQACGLPFEVNNTAELLMTLINECIHLPNASSAVRANISAHNAINQITSCIESFHSNTCDANMTFAPETKGNTPTTTKPSSSGKRGPPNLLALFLVFMAFFGVCACMNAAGNSQARPWAGRRLFGDYLHDEIDGVPQLEAQANPAPNPPAAQQQHTIQLDLKGMADRPSAGA